MRFVLLEFLWLAVGGFGLMTLCSGFYVVDIPVIAIPFGAVTGLCAFGVFKVIQSVQSENQVPQHESVEPDSEAPTPPRSQP